LVITNIGFVVGRDAVSIGLGVGALVEEH